MARMTLEEALEATENAAVDIPEWVTVVEEDAHPHDDGPHLYIEGIFPDGLKYEDGLLTGELEEMLALYEGAQNVVLAVALPLL